MSLHPQATYPIPEESQRVARAAFPRGNVYMQVADRLGTIYHDAQFAALFPTRGQPAEAPARLAPSTLNVACQTRSTRLGLTGYSRSPPGSGRPAHASRKT